MRLRNNIFASAFDELKRNHGIKTQKELARRMGVSEDTITRIMKDRTEVTEDIITKLQTASGCIFNLQWLRGEDAFNMLAIDAAETKKKEEKKAATSDNALSVYIQLVDSLKAHLKSKEAEMQSRLNEKDRTIDALEKRIKEKEEILEYIRKENADLKAQIANSSYTYPFPHGVADDKKDKRIRK